MSKLILTLVFFASTLNVNYLFAQKKCSPPTGIQATAVGSNYAKITWNKSVGSFGYCIRGRVVGSPDWISMNVLSVDSSAKISNLKSNSQYELQVVSFCNNSLSDSSTWSQKIIFHTDFPCQIPTKLYADNITSTTATLHWMGPLNSAKFLIRYKLNEPNSKWKTLELKNGYSDSVDLNELNPGSNYLWIIACNCLGNALNESEFSAPMKFTTMVH